MLSIKSYFQIAVLIGFLSCIGFLYYKYNSIILQNKSYEQKIHSLSSELDGAKQEIERAIKEKALINESLNEMTRKAEQNLQTAKQQKQRISKFKSDPQSQREISPVLKDTLKMLKEEE